MLKVRSLTLKVANCKRKGVSIAHGWWKVRTQRYREDAKVHDKEGNPLTEAKSRRKGVRPAPLCLRSDLGAKFKFGWALGH